MSRDRPLGQSEWIFESLIRVVPGINGSRRRALLAQFVGFELAVLGLAWYHGLAWAGIVGTVGVIVSVAGSVCMLRLAAIGRETSVSERYRTVLFASNVELVLGLLAFLLLLVYVFVIDPTNPGESLLEAVAGSPPAPSLTFLFLLIAWDVTYRIGVGWVASLLGCWQTIRNRHSFSVADRRRFHQTATDTIGFAGVQVFLLPVLSGHPLLQLAIAGHVLAVITVSGLSLLLLRQLPE